MFCSLEGQVFPVEDNIAQDDEKLKDFLRPHIPNIESAQIFRDADKPVEIILKAGTKGTKLGVI